MKQILLPFAVFFYGLNGLCAQEIHVKRFGEISEIQMVSMQRKDANGGICALVRVGIPSNEAVLFQGNVIGDAEYKGNEYMVYMTEGSRFLRIHYPNCETLMIDFTQYGYEGLASKRVYELVLSLPSELTQGMLDTKDVGALYDLGVHYLNNKNYNRAIYWFELAAKEGNVDAQYGLASCYINIKEYKQAVPWLKKAAQQHHVDAQCDLGVHYFNNKDYTNAVSWFQQSANKGSKKAMEMLSTCYRNGLGVMRDNSLVKYWADKAIDK